MNAVYEGKNIQEWIALLRSGDIVERCAAALALAELGPTAPPARTALVRALNDPEPPVQAAAQAALGLVLHLNAEHRRKMFHVLVGTDDAMQRMILQSLWELNNADVLKTVPQFENMPSPSEGLVADGRIATPPTSRQAPAIEPTAPNSELPDFTLVHVVPWWFLLGATAFCIVMAWLMRGLWWHKWTMVGMAAVAALVMFYTWTRKGTDSHLVKRFRAQARLGGSAIFAAACGFFISIFFPAGAIIIDNESGADVRLLLDGEEWLTVASGESKKKALTRGAYRLTVQSAEGKQILDAHDIEVAGYGKYVLNVLGRQRYFHGTVQYGINGFEMKVMTAKWFPLPEVDYLFQDLPERIVTRNPVNKTFFTRGMPPKLKGQE